MAYVIKFSIQEHKRRMNHLTKFAEENVTRKEVPMEVLSDIFDVPTRQEIIKPRHTSRRKRKQNCWKQFQNEKDIKLLSLYKGDVV